MLPKDFKIIPYLQYIFWTYVSLTTPPPPSLEQCKKTALFVRMGIYKGRIDNKRQNVFGWHSSKASLVKNDHIHAWAPISMSPLDADALLQHIDKSLSNVPPLRNSNPPQSMVFVPAIYNLSAIITIIIIVFFLLSLYIILFYLSLSRHSWVAMLTKAWFTWKPYLIH